MHRTSTIAGAALACTALLATAPSGVLAAKSPQARHAAHEKSALRANVAYGTLASLSTKSAVVVSAGNRTMTISLAPHVRFVAHSQTAAGAGIKAGDQVEIRGSFRNGFMGRTVIYDTVAFAVAPTHVAGTIASSTSTSLTVTLKSGKSVAVHLDSTTRFRVQGQLSLTAPTLAANAKVNVLAQIFTDGTIKARVITIL